MRFLSVAHTDAGTVKEINQDAFCLKIARSPSANIAFAVLCDGMGGMSSGEYASALVVNAFSAWFVTELAQMTAYDLDAILCRWKEIVLDQGQKILAYGQTNGISLGTTLTAFLAVNDGYVCIHVGDSRLYHITDAVRQVTKDQTFVAHEVEQNRMTAEEAENDPRASILLQCVGASPVIEPELIKGAVAEGDVFMLCSDGFRHKISADEMYGVLAPSLLTDEKYMKKSLVDLTELDKSRSERDNITSVLIKAIN